MAGVRSAAEVPLLRGRRDERAVLDGLLDGARTGRSGVLVLRGEAGTYRLRKVFTKPGITCRNQIDGVLPDTTSAD